MTAEKLAVPEHEARGTVDTRLRKLVKRISRQDEQRRILRYEQRADGEERLLRCDAKRVAHGSAGV